MDNLFDFAVAGMKAKAKFDYETKLLCHKDDPDTSRQAAQKMIEKGALNKQEAEVLNTIKRYLNTQTWRNDFTAKELKCMYLDYYVAQRRLSGLYNKGKIERIAEDDTTWSKGCGKKLKRRNNCAVWRLK